VTSDFVWLLLTIAGLVACVYVLTWVLGRAWYAGRLAAISRAFHLAEGKKPWLRKRAPGSSTDHEKRTR